MLQNGVFLWWKERREKEGERGGGEEEKGEEESLKSIVLGKLKNLGYKSYRMCIRAL